jgi:cytochrome c553
MSVRKTVSQALLACVGSLAAATSHATPPAATPDYTFCTVCHGAQGNGNAAIRAPKIAGIEPWYLKRELERFRAHLRGTQEGDVTGMEMQPVALQLDDQAIAAVSVYVGTFAPKTPAKTVSGDAKHGRKLYASCAACHGAKGEGNSSLQAPALAGQTDWYLVTELKDFQAGLRGLSPQDDSGTQMRAAASMLPDDSAIKDVVAYINTLERH